MQEKIIKIVTLVLAVIFGLVSFKVTIVPKARDAGLLHGTLSRIESQLSSIFGEEVTLRGGIEQQEKIMQQLEKLYQQIPSDKDIPRILDEVITKAAQGLGISYQLIEPQKIVAEGNYKKLPLRVKFSSGYYDLVSYLTQLSQLSAIVNVDSLSLQKNAENSDKLDIDLLLNLYVMPALPGEKEASQEVVAPALLINPFAEKKGGSEIMGKMQLRSEKSVGEDLRLQGIWKGKDINVFINGKILKLGDKISGYNLDQIKNKEVVLTKNGKKYILKLK